MTDTLDFAQWARNWEAMARQAISSIPGASAAPSWTPQEAMQRQWSDASAQWTRQFSAGAVQGDAIERMMSGAQGYLGMLQSMAAGSGQSAAASMPWLDALKSSSGFAGASPSWMTNPIAETMRNFGGTGAVGLEQMMERMVAMAGPMLNDVKGVLGTPAFGFMREHQENAQKAAQAMIAYQEQMARYNRLMLKVSEKSFARFQLKLAEREEPGRQIDSVRGVYDVWIDAAEEAYAEIALSEEYREIYGALVNAQMHVREHVHREIERISVDLGVPTRSEINTIGERLQALRREVRADREAAAEQPDLADEVARLREELAALKTDLAPMSRSNVVEFTRPLARVTRAVAPPTAVLAPKPKSKPAKKAAPKRDKGKLGKGKAVASKAKHAAKSSLPVVNPSRSESKRGNSFASSIARFAREASGDSKLAAAKSLKSKSGKR
ncbi:MAG: poly(R)-hydroxyalkanoic acid synthase subunit PhaE [Dokdonella sp.]